MAELDPVDYKAPVQRIEADRGDVETVTWSFDAAIPAITSDTFRCHVRVTENDEEPVATWTCTKTAARTLTVEQDFTDLAGNYVADLEWTPAGGDPETLIRWLLQVRPDVTHD